MLEATDVLLDACLAVYAVGGEVGRVVIFQGLDLVVNLNSKLPSGQYDKELRRTMPKPPPLPQPLNHRQRKRQRLATTRPIPRYDIPSLIYQLVGLRLDGI